MGWPYQQKPPMGWPLDYDSGLVPNVGFWSMLEGSGNTVQDLSRNENDGIFGVGAASPIWVPGKFGLCPSFDGGDKIDADIVKPVNIMVSAWIYNTDVSGGFAQIIAGESGITAQRSWQFRLDQTTGKVTFIIFVGGGTTSVTGSADLTGGWHYVAGTYDGETVRVFVDGIEEDSDGTPSGDLDAVGTSVCIGENQRGGDNFIGRIDIPLIHNHALSASEIALLYQYPFWMFKDPAEVALLGGYQAIVGAAGIMTTNTGYWGPTF